MQRCKGRLGRCWVEAARQSPVRRPSSTAAACTFSEGTIVKCAKTGAISKVEAGKLRAFSATIYQSWGSPGVMFTDSTVDCCQTARCPAGSPMPLNSGEVEVGRRWGGPGPDLLPFGAATHSDSDRHPPASSPSFPTGPTCGPLQANKDFYGADLHTCPEQGIDCAFDGVPSIAACCDKCRGKEGCGSFTFKWDDAAHTTGTCWLKQASGHIVSDRADYHSAYMVNTGASAGALMTAAPTQKHCQRSRKRTFATGHLHAACNSSSCTTAGTFCNTSTKQCVTGTCPVNWCVLRGALGGGEGGRGSAGVQAGWLVAASRRCSHVALCPTRLPACLLPTAPPAPRPLPPAPPAAARARPAGRAALAATKASFRMAVTLQLVSPV